MAATKVLRTFGRNVRAGSNPAGGKLVTNAIFCQINRIEENDMNIINIIAKILVHWELFPENFKKPILKAARKLNNKENQQLLLAFIISVIVVEDIPTEKIKEWSQNLLTKQK